MTFDWVINALLQEEAKKKENNMPLKHIFISNVLVNLSINEIIYIYLSEF